MEGIHLELSLREAARVRDCTPLPYRNNEKHKALNDPPRFDSRKYAQMRMYESCCG
jgi:hypothetical protein